MHGLSAARGHAESAKQRVPSPLVSEITAGTPTNKTKSAARIAATRALRGFALAMEHEIILSLVVSAAG
jgi:hypothetical protein